MRGSGRERESENREEREQRERTEKREQRERTEKGESERIMYVRTESRDIHLKLDA